MARLALINNNSFREGINNIDDVIGVFKDSHRFDDNELTKFNIIDVGGDLEVVRAVKDSVNPEIINVYKNKDGDWADKLTIEDLVVAELETKAVWDDSGIWREVKEYPKYMTKYTTKFEDNISAIPNNQIPITVVEVSNG